MAVAPQEQSPSYLDAIALVVLAIIFSNPPYTRKRSPLLMSSDRFLFGVKWSHTRKRWEASLKPNNVSQIIEASMMSHHVWANTLPDFYYYNT